MTLLQSSGIRLAILFIFLILCPKIPHAQHTDTPAIAKEVSKQENIYRSRGGDIPEGYVIDRSLLSYRFFLSPEFVLDLARLGETDRWLDIGAGMGQAILDYHGPRYELMHPEVRTQRGKKAQAIALSVEDRRTPIWNKTALSLAPNKIGYFFGKRLREYSSGELGKFQLITDLLGGFSYTENLSLFMEKALGFLAIDGNFYTLLLDVHLENGTNQRPPSELPYLTRITNTDGTEVKMCTWLKRITCIKVTCDSKGNPPIEIYRIHKVCNNISVPALNLIHYEAGTPPERQFQLLSSSSASLP